MDDLTLIFALIGVLGVGSQWLAVQLRLPAIVFMLLAGVMAGPVLGLIDPRAAFGDMFGPIIAIAVAVILFEGGITLNFHELRDAALPVRRLCTWGAVLGWVANTAAGHLVAGLDLVTAAIFGGILVVTGPTVIMPLLRQARLTPRVSSTLRWEAIINDPVGALFAVLTFELAVALQADHLVEAVGHLSIGIVTATLVGFAAGRGVGLAFRRGLVPEYMKAPVLFVSVLAVYASTDWVLHESGLLAVTVMGVVIANMRLPSLGELKRFKEQVTVLLVSGVFVLLAASLDFASLAALDWRAGLFVAAVMLIARPMAVLPALIGTKLETNERLLVAWVAPRGVVAVAISGFFGERLVELGFADGAMLGPLAFVLVAVTVVVHGFSLAPLARQLGLTSTEPPGVIVLGANPVSIALTKALRDGGVPIVMVDRNWRHLGPARAEGWPSFNGELLSEAAEHAIDLARYGTLVAMTENDDYNALVCTDLGPELGREQVFQVGRHESSEGEADLPVTIGGRTLLGSGRDLDLLGLRIKRGWHFAVAELAGGTDLAAHLASRHGKAEAAAIIRRGEVLFDVKGTKPRAGDLIVSFEPAPVAEEPAPAEEAPQPG
ncbi:MAG: sodium:proton antiporter [Pseudomonadota bacterium]